MKPPTPSAKAGYLIKEVQLLLRRRMDQALGHLAITTPQFAALTWLARTPGLSNADLAQRCFVTPQTMNLIVKKLEERGLVSRSQSAHHGKILPLALTTEGARMLEQSELALTGVERSMFGVLSASELKGLVSALEKLRATDATATDDRADPVAGAGRATSKRRA